MKTFFELFAGRTDAYGIYRSEELRADGKKKGRGHTIQRDLDYHVWDDHLAGKHDSRLGIIPICRGNTVNWFAADIDDYKIDHQKLVAKINSQELPGIVVRSKSGGAHIFFFTREPIPASLGISVMKHVVDVLGLGRVEIFPKQDTLVDDDAIGNWIHLPYYRADDPDSWALGSSAEKLSFTEFVQAANARLLTREEAASIIVASVAKDNLKEAPPCVQIMLRDGVEEGGRNNAMFHLGVFYRKSDPDNWRDSIHQTNQSQLSPSLPYAEVQKIISSLGKKEYQYKCHDQPMASICDKSTCLKRKWGVGPDIFDDYDEVDTSVIYRHATTPVMFEVRVGEKKVMISEEALTSRGGTKFRNRIFVETGLLMRPEKQPAYDKRLKNMKIIDVEMPEGTTRDSIILREFRDWSANRILLILNIEGIVETGNPFYDVDTKMIIFRSRDFVDHLVRNGKVYSAYDVWEVLKEEGCTSGNNIKIGGRATECWMFPVKEIWFELPNREKF